MIQVCFNKLFNKLIEKIKKNEKELKHWFWYTLLMGMLSLLIHAALVIAFHTGWSCKIFQAELFFLTITLLFNAMENFGFIIDNLGVSKDNLDEQLQKLIAKLHTGVVASFFLVLFSSGLYILAVLETLDVFKKSADPVFMKFAAIVFLFLGLYMSLRSVFDRGEQH